MSAEKIVTSLLDGKVGDWFADKWDTAKQVVGDITGVGRDDFGMGKPEKGFKPKYDTAFSAPTQRRSYSRRRMPDTSDNGKRTWRVG